MFHCFTNAEFAKLYQSMSPEADITTLRRQNSKVLCLCYGCGDRLCPTKANNSVAQDSCPVSKSQYINKAICPNTLVMHFLQATYPVFKMLVMH